MKINDTLIGVLLLGLRGAAHGIRVNFIKKDGEARMMICTLDPNLIPDEHAPKGGGVIVDEEEPTYVRVFDIEKQGWRSIIFDNITNFEAVA